MKLTTVVEMAKAITAKTCAKCGNPIMDRNYYYYKGTYNHKGGCPQGTSPSNAQPSASPQPAAPRAPSQPAAPRASSQHQDILEWLSDHDIQGATILPGGIVDVDGDVDIDISDFTKLPVQFGTVTGHFDISGLAITTLEGCPHAVGGTFNCSYTDIKNFKGGPTTVGRSYLAGGCEKLVSFEGLPDVVPGIMALNLGTPYTAEIPPVDKIPDTVLTPVGLPSRCGSLILPIAKMDLHNIHKHVKFVKNLLGVYADKSLVKNMLGIALIDGLRDGVMMPVTPMAAIFMKYFKARNTKSIVPPKRDDEEKELFRNALLMQEELIDAGYAEEAGL